MGGVGNTGLARSLTHKLLAGKFYEGETVKVGRGKRWEGCINDKTVSDDPAISKNASEVFKTSEVFLLWFQSQLLLLDGYEPRLEIFGDWHQNDQKTVRKIPTYPV